MEYLLKAMKKFNISKDGQTFEDELDTIIEQMNILATNDPDYEWTTIKMNYSRLKYIDDLILFYDFYENNKFLQTLTKVLDDIDKINQYYLKNLTWELYDVQDELNVTKQLLYDSLNQNDPIEKLKIVLNAYSVLIPVIEDFRNEIFIYDIKSDPLFEKLESMCKKRKIN